MRDEGRGTRGEEKQKLETPEICAVRQAMQVGTLLRWRARELCRQCRHLQGCLVMQQLERAARGSRHEVSGTRHEERR